MTRPFRVRRSTRYAQMGVILWVGTAIAQVEGPESWRLQQGIGSPDWLRVRGELRLRYEGLDGQYRGASRLDHADQLLLQRTLLRGDADLDPVGFTLELLDARHYGGGTGSVLTTGNVNTLSVLQALVRMRWDEHVVRVGRQTIDLGSRRLVSRNRFRNSINSYTGVDWQWQRQGEIARAFWNMPVRRQPRDLQSLVDNEAGLDQENLDQQLFGVLYHQELSGGVGVELYGVGLYERGGGSLQRRLWTPGLHLRSAVSPGAFDWEMEAAYQFGKSRLTAAGADLDHSASFEYARLGYTFDHPVQPRVRVGFERRSGDRDPADGANHRFDPLFGVRLLGPPGLYGAVPRNNVLTPEVRFELTPEENLHWFLSWRGVWLDRKRDAWTAAGVQDPTGRSGRHIGEHLESRLRWEAEDETFRLDVGAAYLFVGGFPSRAPGGRDTDTAYGFVEFSWRF